MRFALLLLAASVSAQAGADILLVVNQNFADSKSIGDDCAKRRAVPAKNRCLIDTAAVETIDRRTFDDRMAAPIRDCLLLRSLRESILYLVTTLGVPLRIDGNGGRMADLSAVDSELTLLYAQSKGGLRKSAQGPGESVFQAGFETKFEPPRFAMYLVHATRHPATAGWPRPPGSFRPIGRFLDASDGSGRL